MNSNANKANTNSDVQRDLGGWGLSDILRDLGISWQLLRDPQVSFLLKMCLPLFALFYWLSPIDLMVGMPFDDIAVVVVATRLFVQMAPRAAVERALMRTGRYPQRTTSTPSDQPDRDIWDIWEDEDDANTISGQWRVVDDEK